jgi:large subunit ribosomal protein L30
MVAEMKRLRVTQIKSGIGYHYSQKATLQTLGLRRLNQSIEIDDTPTTRGMLRKVGHLIRVDELTTNGSAETDGTDA